MTDDSLISTIETALLRDTRLSSQPIHVSARHGVVTLRGAVQSYRRKLAASEVAGSFEDCRGVVNELVVEPPVSLGDEAIATLARSALEAQADVAKPSITVSVNAGLVILSGAVGSEWERRIAEDVTLSVQGVREVRNLLIVDAVARKEGESLSSEIEAAMRDARGLRDTAVHAAVVGEAVVLSGRVTALWQKEAAEAVVSRFGFFRIRNDIVVAPPED